MKNWFTIMFLHMYGSLTLNQLQLIMHTHDFRLKLGIRVLRVHQKIDSLRVKINAIKRYHCVPYEKSSKLGYSLDPNNSVFRIFKFNLGVVFLAPNFETELRNLIQNIFNSLQEINRPRAWSGLLSF